MPRPPPRPPLRRAPKAAALRRAPKAAALALAAAALAPRPALGTGDRPSPPAGPPLLGEPREALRARREAAHRLDRLAQRGRRDTHDLALDPALVAEPEASG